jgi:mono/diheme cytochrome c family protein
MNIKIKLVLAVAACGAVGLSVLGWFAFAPGPLAFAGGKPIALAGYKGPPPTGVPAEMASSDLIARGEYLARAADCTACHTAKGGKAFAGGRAFKLPFGTLYTPNITPDADTGIGSWSDAEFVRAVHNGIAKDGTRLYPAFPYASYTMLTDEDVLAIKAFLFSVPAVHRANTPSALAFPFNQRWLMAIWGVLFNPNDRFKPLPGRSPEWNRGAYLVEAAAHCGECHSPRNLMQAIDNRSKFAGGVAEGWTAYNITLDAQSGVGDWTPAEISKYLSAGHAQGRGSASGPMAEAIDMSLRHLTPSDVAAMATYLKTVPPVRSKELPPVAKRVTELNRDDAEPSGKRVFEGACASCHAWSGGGATIPEAALSGSRAVNDPSATNVVQMILNGTGPVAPGSPFMPGFAVSYGNDEIAALSNYVTARFGASASRVSAKDVSRLRALN